ncbi:putative gustatory receptor 28b [Aethina tumida]|uniref:putative gustatory receptor 28b n=1 Tax=Aethina tumida TaxID=116153 RepID=UPI0021472BD1|nr:putative gustatory receptor 28b [Aethina tumida]
MTLETLTTILGQLMCVGALTSLVTYESLWMDYFNQVWLLKSTLKLKFDVYKFKLIVVAVALDIFWIVTNAIFIKYIYGAFSHLLYVDIIVHSLYHLTCSYFIVNVVKFTRQCLAQTNKVLQQRLLSATNDLPAKIRHITIIYEDIRTLNKIFEDLFGWRMLLMIVGAGLIMLNTFNFLLQLLLTSENVLIIATTLLIGLFGVSSSVWVMQECDATANEGQTIATTALKYEKNFPLNSEERRELMRLAGCVMHRKIAFTAAGFFGVNRRNIFALFGTATTYFIILIQLMNV